MDGADKRYVKVAFRLEPDADGWPPVTREGLWALPIGEDLARLDNPPFFARGVAVGDIVRTVTDSAGERWAGDRVESSGHCTIRVVTYPDGPLGGDRHTVLDRFAPLGVTGEGAQQFAMVALDVAPDVEVAPVRSLLERGVREGWWDVEEGCVDDRWTAG
jgi:Domain of unknown function (DUF4265)